MRETIKKTREYLDYIEEHYNNVQKAWNIVKDKCKDLSFMCDDYRYSTIEDEVKKHDLSKLSMEEFVQYRENFFPVSDEEKELAKPKFQAAWDNHKEKNAHHWQTWTQTEDHIFTEVCIVHNVCDWMAMGMKFNDTAKSYYEKNKADITVPEWAESLIYDIFDRVY